MRHFFLTLLLFLLIVIFLQFLIGSTPFFEQADLKKIDTFAHSKIDIVYFGDSVIGHIAISNKNHNAMPQLLQNKLFPLSVGTIDHGSYSTIVYDAFTTYMQKTKYSPHYIIVPIKLRSFSPDWEYFPPFQFEQEIGSATTKDSLLYPFASFISAYKGSISMTLDQFKRLPVVYENKKVGIIGDFDNPTFLEYSEKHQKEKMLLYYLYTLSKKDAYIQSLQHIAQKYSHTKPHVLFYITPVDYQTGEKYFDKPFTNQVRKNAAVILNALSEKHALVLDLSLSLPHDDFDWKNEVYINEHLNQTGREFVVNQLFKQITQ